MGWDPCMLCCCFTSSSDTFPDQSKLKWQIFPYKQLTKATNYFNQGRILDKKSFATTYYGKIRSLLHEKKRVNIVIDEIVPKFETIVQLSPWIFLKGHNNPLFLFCVNQFHLFVNLECYLWWCAMLNCDVAIHIGFKLPLHRIFKPFVYMKVIWNPRVLSDHHFTSQAIITNIRS
jgi:hypothetical protein